MKESGFLDTCTHNEIPYNPTTENIRLTPEQDGIMCQMISHIKDAPTVIKSLTRWQFWFRQVWDRGAAAKEKQITASAPRIGVLIDNQRILSTEDPMEQAELRQLCQWLCKLHGTEFEEPKHWERTKS